MYIALLEPDSASRSQLASTLRKAGHHVTDMVHAAALTRHLAAHPCDIVVISHREPNAENEAMIARLRAHRRLGIVALVDARQHSIRVAVLESGADACVTRPYEVRELTAAVESLARRLRNAQDGELAEPDATDTSRPSDAWLLVSRKWLLLSPDGEQVRLTASECSLLSLLLQQAGKPVSRREIVTALGYDYRHYDERRLEALVSRLRRKLGRPPDRTPIRVAHGFGYAFTASGLVS